MSKVKAQLRQGISEAILEENRPANVKLEQVKASREGRLILDMISEFLQTFGLKHSAGVFAAETGLTEDFDAELRQVIQGEVKLSPLTEINEPLLLALLR